jgi:hypothetical protein
MLNYFDNFKFFEKKKLLINMEQIFIFYLKFFISQLKYKNIY